MHLPPAIDNEADRVQSLRSIALLPAWEVRYNELAELAAFISHTPISTISIVDADDVWFKATIGLAAESVRREHSICGHTVAAMDTVVIADTLLDARFANNPLVIQKPYVRFYAGVPLIVDAGTAVGTLCVMDTRPRAFLSDERRALEILGRQVVAQLQADRATSRRKTGRA